VPDVLRVDDAWRKLERALVGQLQSRPDAGHLPGVCLHGVLAAVLVRPCGHGGAGIGDRLRPGVGRGDVERSAIEDLEGHDHVGAFARSDQQTRHRRGRAQESALGADLRERQRHAAALVDEVVDARLGAVDDPQSVAARLDVDERPDCSGVPSNCGRLSPPCRCGTIGTG
jgi:hypothetical protein